MVNWFKQKITALLVRYLTGKVRNYEPFAISTPESLASVLQVGDVILVEGNQRFSTAVKYLTQSTWSHAAIYVGQGNGLDCLIPETPSIIEADLQNGVIAVPLSKYAEFNTRICRPIGLDADERQKVVQFMVDSIGMNYDLKNVIDLARYLIPTPPVPDRWRRSMLALGSGDPTRVICSTRIAQAFQSVGYPILPRVELLKDKECESCRETVREILHIRHHSLFTPRDFDVSPFFAIIKPTIERGFDHKQMNWSDKEVE
ncbi:MAG: YiiX/YebB-like N1pC/P60 family cysteine hydrolase [Woeseiaceae bacterium]